MNLRFFNSIKDIPAAAWDALHTGDNPFASHAFLLALEASQSLRPAWGWRAHHITYWKDDALIAVAPGYLKDNSHGEFVFDHAWADAYARYGRDYYPKYLIGIPYSPITGPRLLARDIQAKKQLLFGIRQFVVENALSSAHVNFITEESNELFDTYWAKRHDVQFHWQNAGWGDFESFLASLNHKRRKAIRQERQRVQRQGIGFRLVTGHSASEADLKAMHDFYCLTFMQKGNSPALTGAFFSQLAKKLPDTVVIIFAERDARPIAGAFFIRGKDTLYGRYWGCEEDIDGLHFETCYYQGIDYCLREGLQHFEPGAQGEHKLARGFLPVLTHSRHFIADPDLGPAIHQWCLQERQATLDYRLTLQQHSPFKHAHSSPTISP